jgi:hypothetical protein
VQLSRRFHRPTNLRPADRVSIVVDDLPEGGRVSLNGAGLGPGNSVGTQAAIFPTPRLEPHNVLTLEFEIPATTTGGDRIWGEVALLISSP